MKKLILIALALASTAALAANLVSQTVLPDGRMICVYSDGTSLVTTFNHCPSFK
jgi:hypothetical protein